MFHSLRCLWFTSAVGLAAAGCAHTHATPPPPSAVPPTKPDREQAVETGISVSSTPQGLLQEGGEKKIQQKLRSKGFLTEAQVNGQLDPTTRTALSKYQKSEGLPATGLPSYETVRSLGLDLDTVFHTIAEPKEPASARSPGAEAPERSAKPSPKSSAKDSPNNPRKHSPKKSAKTSD